MIDILIRLLILAWPFGQLLILSPLSAPYRLHLLDVLSMVIVFLVLVISKERDKLFRSSLTKPLLTFLFISLLSFFVNSRSLIALLSLIRMAVYLALLVKLSYSIDKNNRNLIIIAACLFIFFGMLQYIFIPDTRSLRLLGFDDHYYRLIGTLLDPNFSGAILGMIALWLIGSNNNKLRLLALVPLLELVLTLSRGSYLAFLIGLIYLIIVKLPRKFIFIIPLFVLIVIFIPKPFGEGGNLLRTFSVQSRLDSSLSGIRKLEQRPLLGFGFDRNLSGSAIPYLSGGFDNSFIFIAVNTGLVGLMAFLWFLKSLLKGLPPQIATCVLLILSHSLFNNTFLYPWVIVTLGILTSFREVTVKTSK